MFRYFFCKIEKGKRAYHNSENTPKILLNQKIHRKGSDFFRLDNSHKQRHLVTFWVSYNILPCLQLHVGKMLVPCYPLPDLCRYLQCSSESQMG